MKTTFVISAMLAGLAVASPSQQPPKAACKVKTDCKPNEHCDSTGACVVNKAARDAPLAELHQACKTNGDCVKGLLCEKDTCIAPKGKRDTLSELGQPCHLTGDCIKGLVCGQDDTCIAPRDKRDAIKSHLGQQCKDTGDCAKGLRCEKDTCLSPKDKRDGPESDAALGKKCHHTGDCVKGLVCEKDTCIAPKDKRDNSKSQIDQPCKVTGDCVKGLACDAHNNTCTVPKDTVPKDQKRDGAPDQCQTTADCDIHKKETCQEIEGNKVCAAPQSN